MSSWVSHLPPEVKYGKVLGHGLNAAELAKNKQMDSFFVRDLNAEPDGWALGDQSVDAVVCCVRCATCRLVHTALSCSCLCLGGRKQCLVQLLVATWRLIGYSCA